MSEPETSGVSVAEKPGRVLGEERRRQNLSVNEVANKLRISHRQVEALEADEYDKLPGATFVRGFMRNYARMLQLDPEPLLKSTGLSSSSDAYAPINAPSQNIRFSGEQHSRAGRGLWIAAIAILALALVGWMAWRWDKIASVFTPEPEAAPRIEQPLGSQPAAEVSVVPTPEPVAAATAPPLAAMPATEASPASPAPAADAASAAEVDSAMALVKGSLVLEFSGDSWVEIRNKNDQVVFSKLSVAGERQEMEVEPPVHLTVGSADHVKVKFKDRSIDLAPHTKVSVARLTLTE